MDGDPDLHLSLRRWPSPSPQESAVPNLISRIQAQRGHFREINEASLEAELSAPPASNASAPEEDSAPTDNEDPTQKLSKAKAMMNDLLGNAHNEALFALDFISLVTSLHAPEPSKLTMSPSLRAAVPVGSLGYDRITRKVDKKAVEEDAKVARAWKLDGLNSAADALLGASQKLGKEVERETRYWEGVLAIRNDGWLITRMPRERNVLGVRYGFAEAAREYKDKGIGALRRNEDGSVRMDDVDTSGKKGRAMLRVRVLQNGKVVGTSTHRAGRNDGSVRDMIRRARNFIYDDELFFELMKEARMFAGVGMRTNEDAAMIELGEGKMIVLDMAPLDDESPAPSPHNTLAETISLALRILLSYNHRLALKRRSQPPPPLSSQKPPVLPLQLLRPITTNLYHHAHISNLTDNLKTLRSYATTAGLPAAFTVTPLRNTAAAEIKDVESAVETFLDLLVTEATMQLPGGWSIAVGMRTRLQHPHWGTQYTVATQHDGVAARLMSENRFATEMELEGYLWWVLERSVVNWIRLEGGWEQEAQGNELVRVGRTGGRLRVEVEKGVGLGVTWGYAGGRDEKFVWDGTEKGRSLRELLTHIEGGGKNPAS